jgi:hypothetical protein
MTFGRRGQDREGVVRAILEAKADWSVRPRARRRAARAA